MNTHRYWVLDHGIVQRQSLASFPPHRGRLVHGTWAALKSLLELQMLHCFGFEIHRLFPKKIFSTQKPQGFQKLFKNLQVEAGFLLKTKLRGASLGATTSAPQPSLSFLLRIRLYVAHFNSISKLHWFIGNCDVSRIADRVNICQNPENTLRGLPIIHWKHGRSCFYGTHSALFLVRIQSIPLLLTVWLNHGQAIVLRFIEAPSPGKESCPCPWPTGVSGQQVCSRANH